MNNIVLITGATSGFGEACAIKFAQEGCNVIITGRRLEKLQNLQLSIEKKYHTKVLSLCFDIQSKEAVFNAIASLPTEWQKIDVLINNAGLALGRDNFADASIEDWEIMIDTNIKGLMYITKAVVPKMIEANKGHIVNIGSTAGKEVYENGNGYCASKHAVDAISKAMRIDLLKHNIKVTAIHPGAAQTQFSVVRFKGEEQKANAVYDNYMPLQALDIAETVFYCTNLPKHVCINDLVITCTQQANSFYLHKKR
jgi:3-hydroxy acid dehydrogenase / malonic semialdehyde reductase